MKQFLEDPFGFIYIKIMFLLSFLHTNLLKMRKNIYIGKHSYVFVLSHLFVMNHSKSRIHIGDYCKIGRSKYKYHSGIPFYTVLLSDGEDSCICIGNHSRINGAYIHAKKSIEIGDNCVIASGVNIVDTNGHLTRSFDRTKGTDIPKGIKIGNNVWIGINSVILKGTEIGDNCVVSAGCVVKGKYGNNTLIFSDTSCKHIEIGIDK